ncbi:MAG: hypothetical protein C1O27_002540, partial [Chloroflexi bacterium]
MDTIIRKGEVMKLLKTRFFVLAVIVLLAATPLAALALQTASSPGQGIGESALPTPTPGAPPQPTATPMPTPTATPTVDGGGQRIQETSVEALNETFPLPQTGADYSVVGSVELEAWDRVEVRYTPRFSEGTTTITTLDSSRDVGKYTSVTTGADGLGLISYYDHTNQDLKVAHCSNAACTEATITTLDSEG